MVTAFELTKNKILRDSEVILHSVVKMSVQYVTEMKKPNSRLEIIIKRIENKAVLKAGVGALLIYSV